MGDQKQETKSEPWEAVQPMLKNFYGSAMDTYRSGTPMLGAQSPYTTQANQAISQMAGRPIGPSAEFNDALDFQAGKMTDDISRGFGLAGRSGSVAHQNALLEQVGGMRNAATANEVARQEGLQARNLGMLGQVGAQQDARANAETPWARLGAYGGLLSGAGGLGGTTTQTVQGDPLSTIAGLGLTGLGMMSGMPALGAGAAGPIDIRPWWMR